MVIKERNSRALAAHVVPAKGAAVEWVVKQFHRDLHRWGIRDSAPLVVKSDGEHAIVDLVTAVAEARAQSVAELGRTNRTRPKGGVGLEWVH